MSSSFVETDEDWSRHRIFNEFGIWINVHNAKVTYLFRILTQGMETSLLEACVQSQIWTRRAGAEMYPNTCANVISLLGRFRFRQRGRRGKVVDPDLDPSEPNDATINFEYSLQWENHILRFLLLYFALSSQQLHQTEVDGSTVQRQHMKCPCLRRFWANAEIPTYNNFSYNIDFSKIL